MPRHTGLQDTLLCKHSTSLIHLCGLQAKSFAANSAATSSEPATTAMGLAASTRAAHLSVSI